MENLIVLDLELTGLDIEAGERIVSLGLVKLGKQPSRDTKREWFFNPEKPSGADGLRIHGLTEEFLSQFPDFQALSAVIHRFIGNGTIIHHCWFRESDDTSTDERALNMEFSRAGLNIIPHSRWINIKKAAIALSATANSLNDMLDRFNIDRSARNKHHGALIDAELTTTLFRKMRQIPETSSLLQKLMP